MLEISPASYMTLCALVSEALQTESDATPVLERVAAELAQAALPAELANDASKRAALEQAGFIRKAS